MTVENLTLKVKIMSFNIDGKKIEIISHNYEIWSTYD